MISIRQGCGVSKVFNKEKTGGDELQNKYLVNEKIKTPRVTVIGADGVNHGQVSIRQALDLAHESGLDLVQVGVKENIPVTKVMDFGKFLYEKKKQINESKKTQKTMQLKEIKMRPNIGDQDYVTKLNKAEEFFKEGNKVKFTLQFKGREITMIGKLAPELFVRITTDLQARNVGTLVEEKEQRGGSYWS